ncbi:hypothetical protein ETA_21070 [Erwinia tasmaniensis Et1/99]|uniref:Uncharacterized protein n=1 Tax=Erwinia tasmaniensis (strain DSM 17950 / CFBP 7177 / CIP 109463 / NCPPB 4357 / Et1/99) TaxID=465817 RepID=B2VDE8_ERWT9|nr:hypothetical protein ETA_21070 [Erwinia tasmaniensis Et1/99]
MKTSATAEVYPFVKQALRGNRPVLHGLSPTSQPVRPSLQHLIRAHLLRAPGNACVITSRMCPIKTVSFLSLHAAFPSF